MTIFDKPDELPRWNAPEGASVYPDTARQDAGFPEKAPPFQWFNEKWNRDYEWFRYLSQGDGGISDLPAAVASFPVGHTFELVPEEMYPGIETLRINRANRILDIDIDGRHVFWAESSGSFLEAFKYDLLTETITGPIMLGSVDVNQDVHVLANGDCVIVAWARGATDSGLAALNANDWTIRWDESEIFDAKFAGIALAGEHLYYTFQEGSTTEKSFGVSTATGATVYTHTASGDIVQATNGRFVVFTQSSSGIAVHDMELNELWTASTGSSGPIPRVAMNEKTIWISTGDNNLKVALAQPRQSEFETINLPDLFHMYADVDDIFLRQGAVVISVHRQTHLGPELVQWSMHIDDLDFAGNFGGFATDSRTVYIAGETTTAGEYSIWCLGKAIGPRRWRILDPTNDSSWTRTLAAPI